MLNRSKFYLVFILFTSLLIMSCKKDFDVPQSNRDMAMADPRVTIDLNTITPGLGIVKAQFWDIGTGVNGYMWQAPNPKAVLLFHHGYADYTFRWVSEADKLIPHLLAIGVSVYALDARGHGYSKGDKGLLDVEQGVADHLVARALLKKQSLPVFIMGHSLGGLITTSSMAKTQEGLAGTIVLSAALHYSENSVFTRFLTQSVGAFAPRATLLGSEDNDEDIYLGASTDPVFQNDKLFYRGKIPVKTLETTLKLTKQNPGYYSRITIPTLIIHGSEDNATEPIGSQKLYDGISSPDKTLKFIEGARHAVLDDTKKDEVLAIILNWLKARI